MAQIIPARILAETVRLNQLTARDQAFALQCRAFAYLRLQRWAAALTDLDDAVQLNSNDSKNYYHRSIANAAQKRWDAAMHDFERTSPQLASALFTEAAAALASGDKARYRRTCTKLVTLAETSGQGLDTILAVRALVLVEQPDMDWTRLLRLLEIGLKSNSIGTVGARVQTLVWVRTGRAEDAVSHLKPRLNTPRDNPTLDNLLLCLAYRQLGQAEEASRVYKRALKEQVPVSHVHETLEYQVLLLEAQRAEKQP
jgi:tetratricopeptide (TPR) repeat protein